MKLKFIIFIILFFVLFQGRADAFSKSSAFFAQTEINDLDNKRVNKLEAYLKVNNSPVASYARVFVEEAKRYNLDWRLVAAISGLESSFGNHIPTNSYNAWGWGVYGENVTYFTSWEDGIRTISQGIRERYMNERGAQNIYQIGSTYAASPTWAVRVIGFMERIENYAILNPDDTLSITL